MSTQQTETKEVSTEPRKYAILQETSGEESESWLYFIRYQGNEEALAHLATQLESVEWRIIDGYSTFDLETTYLVSETTAKEMSKVDLNHCSFHRKFDGDLKKVDLGFKPNHSNKKKIKKAFDVLGYGSIEDFIDQEDIDPEDLNPNGDVTSSSESDNSGESSSESESSSSESSSDSDSDDSSGEDSDKQTNPTSSKKKGSLPQVVKKQIDVPRYARAKRRHK